MTETVASGTRLTTRAMRRLLVIASVLVLSIGTPLVLIPAETAWLFSWTVNPPMTAAFLGGAYCSAFLLEFLSSRERTWVRARPAVPAVLLFTALTLMLTLLHLDKFHFGSDFGAFTQAVTWVWLLVYAFVPVVMVVLLVNQMGAPGVDPPRHAPMPVWLRRLLMAQAAILLPLGVGLLVAPTSIAPDFWPWSLSALTGRAIGAWLIGSGVLAAHCAYERDLLRLRGAMASYIAFGALQLFSLARFASADDPVTGAPVLDWANSRIWVYAGFVSSVGLAGLWGWRAAQQARQLEAVER